MEDLTLGQAIYREYLKSDHWRKLHDKYWKSNLPKHCHVCRSRVKLILHHRTYNTLGKERIGRDVILLCRRCHKEIHFPRFLWIERKTQLTKKYLVRRERWLYVKRHTIFVTKRTWHIVIDTGYWFYDNYRLSGGKKRPRLSREYRR